MPLVVTDACVLHTFDYLDSSRIIRLATRDLGIVSVVARGARRPRSKFGSAVDLFAQGVAHVQVKAARDLQTLVSFDLSSGRSRLSSDLDRFVAASAFVELALRTAHDESHHALFDVITTELDCIANAAGGLAPVAGLAACWRLIGELGFSPALDHCCVCHSKLAPDEQLPFSCQGGGVACTRCGSSLTASRLLPAGARAAIRGWLAPGSSGTGSTSDGLRLSTPELRAHQRLLREFLVFHVGDDRELRAFLSWERGAMGGS
ncbi:MAG: DNA repair protein RecO [Gemmatimonadaceae bacterium]|nr:DNA repair protein RecO [Gemmatimonadaceae bacterium]